MVTTLLILLRTHDQRLLELVALRRVPRLDRFMRAITHLADAPVIITLAALLCFANSPVLQRAGRHGAFALAVSHIVAQLLKRTVVRPRPQLPFGLVALIEPPDRFSFPSGHAAAAMSVALPLMLALPQALAPALLALALCVGISRCYLGVHFPGDVVAGWLLAAGGVFVATFML